MSNIIIHKIPDAKLLDSAKQTISKGTIHTINGFVIFRSDDQSIEFWIPHSHIESVERLPQLPCGSPITLQLKTTRIIRFALIKDSDCQAFYASLRILSKPDRVRDLAAFSYVPADCQHLMSRGRPYGWVAERVFADYLRMGLPSDQWFQCLLNVDYELCPTYPRHLFTCSPQSETLKGSAAFRSSARLPMLSYFRPTTLAAICRSSQPLAGLNRRCLDDEHLVDIIRIVNRNAPANGNLCVVDTRPKVNAIGNKAMGKGYEDTSIYKNIDIFWCPIENIHVMRDSYSKLSDLLTNPQTCGAAGQVTPALAALNSCQWLRHIRQVLEASNFIAQRFHAGQSVLVHCSDGWDRTAQTCALAQVMLDPYYRTIAGFQVLIEKEWLQFGHKFLDRCSFLSHPFNEVKHLNISASAGGGGVGGASSSNARSVGPALPDADEIAESGASGVFASNAALQQYRGASREAGPIFLQFLDAVLQLSREHPAAFQFSQNYLVAICDFAYSGLFGTFLFNCEREQTYFKLSDDTYSLWGYLASHPLRASFINPLYKSEQQPDSTISAPLYHSQFSQSITLWRELYARFEFEFFPTERTPFSTPDSQSTALIKSSSASALSRSNGSTISEEDEQLFSLSSSSSSRGFITGFTPNFEGELVCVRTRFEHMHAVERLVLFYQNALAELSNGAAKEADSLEVLQMNSNGDSSSCASSDALSAEFVKVDLDGSNGASGVAATPAEATVEATVEATSTASTTSSAEHSARSKESSPPSGSASASASAAPAPLSRAQLLVLIARLKSLVRTQWPSAREHHCACVTPRLTSKTPVGLLHPVECEPVVSESLSGRCALCGLPVCIRCALPVPPPERVASASAPTTGTGAAAPSPMATSTRGCAPLLSRVLYSEPLTAQHLRDLDEQPTLLKNIEPLVCRNCDAQFSDL